MDEMYGLYSCWISFTLSILTNYAGIISMPQSFFKNIYQMQIILHFRLDG